MLTHVLKIERKSAKVHFMLAIVYKSYTRKILAVKNVFFMNMASSNKNSFKQACAIRRIVFVINF